MWGTPSTPRAGHPCRWLRSASGQPAIPCGGTPPTPPGCATRAERGKARRGEVCREGQAERQEDLQQVPDHPSPRPRHGDLLGSQAQAAPGITRPDPHPRLRTGEGSLDAADEITEYRKDYAHRMWPSWAVTPGWRPGPASGRGGERCGGPPPHEGELPVWHVSLALTCRVRSGLRSR